MFDCLLCLLPCRIKSPLSPYEPSTILNGFTNPEIRTMLRFYCRHLTTLICTARNNNWIPGCTDLNIQYPQTHPNTQI